MSLYLGSPPADAVPIFFATAESWTKVKSSLPAAATAYANACVYEPAPGRILLVPTETGELGGVLCGLEPKTARPEGGEIQVARLLFDLIESRYADVARRNRHAAEIGT
jgi:hypothetical protein